MCTRVAKLHMHIKPEPTRWDTSTIGSHELRTILRQCTLLAVTTILDKQNDKSESGPKIDCIYAQPGTTRIYLASYALQLFVESSIT
jgi:hypothetical protein